MSKVMRLNGRSKAPPLTNDEIRQILLEYFYNRNKNAKSARSDNTGVAAKISVIRKGVKTSHGLSQSQVWSNLTYLISEGWVEPEQVSKTVPLRSGTVIPQVTTYYKITAAGIDKTAGPGRFTMPKFHGINVEATGQNIINVGDGNQVDARYGNIGNELADLKKVFLKSDHLSESEKLAVVADIDTIQSQLAKPLPDKLVIQTI